MEESVSAGQHDRNAGVSEMQLSRLDKILKGPMLASALQLRFAPQPASSNLSLLYNYPTLQVPNMGKGNSTLEPFMRAMLTPI